MLKIIFSYFLKCSKWPFNGTFDNVEWCHTNIFGQICFYVRLFPVSCYFEGGAKGPVPTKDGIASQRYFTDDLAVILQTDKLHVDINSLIIKINPPTCFKVDRFPFGLELVNGNYFIVYRKVHKSFINGITIPVKARRGKSR